MSDLHVYHDGESEWIIAESPEEARRLWREATGYTDEDLPDDELEFTIQDDDEELHITVEDEEILKGLSDEEANDLLDEDPNSGLKRATKTCGQWASEIGKGLLCSSEY